jgi:uncharacterized surface protein with fasciclin (FAS1) repeats
MSIDPLDSELLALKQRALAGDIGGMREAYAQGELQWLRTHMSAERYAHLGVSLDRGDLEAVRSDLATVQAPVNAVNAPIAEADEVKRSLFLQSQRNGLIAVAIVGALALLGLIGYLALRNNDKAADTTAALVVVSDTIPDTLSAETTTANAVTTNPITVSSTSPETLVAPSTVSAGPATATQPAQATVQTTMQSVTTPPVSAAPPVTAIEARKRDVLSAAERSSTFGNFLAMIDAAGLREELQTLNPSTVLAPTESAFSSLPLDVQAGLRSPANKAILARIVRYNVIPQAIALSQFTTSDLKSLEGNTLSVVVGNNKVMINDATVTGADVLTITGVLHAIDKLLVPPGVSLNALAAKPIPGATAPPQTSPPSTQPLVTTAPTTQPPATNPSAAATQVPSGATTTIATPTTKVP